MSEVEQKDLCPCGSGLPTVVVTAQRLDPQGSGEMLGMQSGTTN
jgi:hypothetical protein